MVEADTQKVTGLFDTHCHLAVPELFARREQVLADAWKAGVTQILNIACQPDEFDAALRLCSAYGAGDAGSAADQGARGVANALSPPYQAARDVADALSPPYQGGAGGGDEAAVGAAPRLYLATGIHPHEAAKVQDRDWAALIAMWSQGRVVAAGEMGLDYHYDFSPREVQRMVFARQLDLARAADLPIIIHCREAHIDVVQVLLDHGYAHRAVVFHCFSGTPDEAAELRGHGWWTSFTGVITFKNADTLRQVVLATPADQLMFETDAPYLSPEPVRRMRPNEPQNLAHTVRFAAGLRDTAFAELVAQSTANAMRFFCLQTL